MGQQQPAGRVTASLGLIEAIAADGSVRRLERGDAFFEGETLRSDAGGRAQLRFTDRGMLSLRPDTVLAIDAYAFDGNDPAAGRQQLRLERGGLRAQTGGIAAANRPAYRVQTPVAVIGIRGTIFEAYQVPGGSLLVGTDRGGVAVTSSTGAIAALGIGEGFDFARVNPDGSIDLLLEAFSVSSAAPRRAGLRALRNADRGGERGQHRSARVAIDDFMPDLQPDGGLLMAAFEVGWGVWGGRAQAEDTPMNRLAGANLSRSLLFAGVNPTPVAQLPVIGESTYGGLAEFRGVAGPVLDPTDVETFMVGFDLDFVSGAISGGFINVGYASGLSEGQVEWRGDFDGSLNGAITDLRLTRLEVFDSDRLLGEANLAASSLAGLLTGPQGERHAGEFSFATDLPDGMQNQSVRGVWVIDRQQ